MIKFTETLFASHNDFFNMFRCHRVERAKTWFVMRWRRIERWRTHRVEIVSEFSNFVNKKVVKFTRQCLNRWISRNNKRALFTCQLIKKWIEVPRVSWISYLFIYILFLLIIYNFDGFVLLVFKNLFMYSKLSFFCKVAQPVFLSVFALLRQDSSTARPGVRKSVYF